MTRTFWACLGLGVVWLSACTSTRDSDADVVSGAAGTSAEASPNGGSAVGGNVSVGAAAGTVGVGGSTVGGAGSAGTAGASGSSVGGAGGAPPARVPVLALGPFSACVVNLDQSVKCVGRCGTTGNGGSRDAEPLGLKAQSVAVGRDFACALLTAPVSGSVVKCWGSGAVIQPPIITDAAEVVAGDAHACTRGALGAVTCWGDVAHAAPSGLVAKQLAASGAMTCAIRDDDSVLCWGPHSATPPADLKATHIAVSSQLADPLLGPRYGCAVTTANRVRCWGDDPGHVQAAPATLQAKAIATGRGNACALTMDGSVSCWGTPPRNGVPAPSGVLAAQLVLSFRSAAAVGQDGKLLFWGDVSDGRSML